MGAVTSHLSASWNERVTAAWNEFWKDGVSLRRRNNQYSFERGFTYGQKSVLAVLTAHFLIVPPADLLTDWLPIETAPKDGSEILLHGPVPDDPTRVSAGFWCIPEGEYLGDCGGECRCPEYGEPEREAFWMSQDGGFSVEWPATHWRPLPSAPMKENINA